MYCINCGILLPDGANFCYKCGQRQSAGFNHTSFSYKNLVQYDFDDLETIVNRNNDDGFNQKQAYIIANKGGKLGLADECFEHLFVPCLYDRISICTQGHILYTKAILDNKVYLYENAELILDTGVDEIYIQNRKWESFAFYFKDKEKYGFRMKRWILNPATGKSVLKHIVYNAEYDNVSIRDDIDAVVYKKEGKWGMIGIKDTELPCVFDGIRIERQPAAYDSITSIHNMGSGPERISLIVIKNGFEYKYPEVRGPKPNSRGFDLRHFNMFFYTW